MDELAGMASKKEPTAGLSVRISASVAARARATARDLAGKPWYLSLSKLTEEALIDRIAHYERLMAVDEDGKPSSRTSPSRNSLHR
jgi:hypothetical protein